MSDPTWIREEELVWAHDQQILRHGGKPGLRDAGLLESALNRPLHRHSYGTEEVAELAAAYAFGLGKNHPFFDGNKRSAWIALRFFIALNGYQLNYRIKDAVDMVLALAAGQLTEAELVTWLQVRLHTFPRPSWYRLPGYFWVDYNERYSLDDVILRTDLPGQPLPEASLAEGMKLKVIDEGGLCFEVIAKFIPEGTYFAGLQWVGVFVPGSRHTIPGSPEFHAD